VGSRDGNKGLTMGGRWVGLGTQDQGVRDVSKGGGTVRNRRRGGKKMEE